MASADRLRLEREREMRWEEEGEGEWMGGWLTCDGFGCVNVDEYVACLAHA